MVDTLYPKWERDWTAGAHITLQEMNIVSLGLKLEPTVTIIMQTIEQGKPYGLSK